MVERLAVGAPLLEFPVPMAPIAPEPLAPVVSTPENDITEIEERTLWERLAVMTALLNCAAEKALQISELPL